MAMVNGRRQRNQLIAAGGVGAAAIADSLLANRQLVRALVNRVADLSNRGPSTRQPTQKKGKKSAGKQKSDKGGSFAPNSMMLYKSVGRGGVSTVTIQDKFLDTISNTSANQSANYLIMSLYNQNGSAATTFSSLSTKLLNFRSLYRHYRINWVKFTWIPSVTDQVATGNFMLKVDSDPSNEANTIVPTRYMVSDTHILTPIAKGATTVWKPSEAKEREERYTAQISGATARTPDELGFGVVQYYAPNNLAISTLLGYVAYEVSVTYSNPTA